MSCLRIQEQSVLLSGGGQDTASETEKSRLWVTCKGAMSELILAFITHLLCEIPGTSLNYFDFFRSYKIRMVKIKQMGTIYEQLVNNTISHGHCIIT